MNRALLWLSRRPLRLAHAVGAALGWLVYAASPPYRQRLRANAALAGVSAAERRASVADAGRMVMELPRLWLRPPGAPICDPVHWQGAELIEQLLAQGRGLILLTPHFGSWEVAGQAYAERFGKDRPMTALYRPARHRWVRELEEAARARPAMATAPATVGGVRQLIRALRRGDTVGLLPDQVPPDGMGIWAPFFGQPAYTMTLAARLVEQTGAAVCLIWGERLSAGAGYRVQPLPLPEPLPARGDMDEQAWTLACAAAVNRAMESMILRRPSQYLWGYHRYKQPRRVENS